ncbi:polysaccharide deacetylase family protein [Paenibacillus sp. GCM10012306]|uniref:polysaccharide deacetylase n=1 Tax=Paenibacillus sp. GCM10012306 TaxID=3317342 RepID=UPI003609ABD0
MTGNNNSNGRRILIRGLLLMTIALLVTSGWRTDYHFGSTRSLSLQTTNVEASSIQHNRLNAPVQADTVIPAVRAALATTPIAIQAVNSAPIQPPTLSTTAPQTGVVQQVAAKAAKTVYLTFDDGPSKITREVLDILQKEGVKATFFVLGNAAKSYPELINAIWEQGHTIGNHSYDHDYHNLYSGFTAFWDQIKQTENIIREITGERPRLVRAPGGTFGHFDDTYFQLLNQAGYLVMDWTVDSGDSRRKGVPAAEILQESTKDLTSSEVVLLLHDGGGHGESAKALPGIIARYKAAGYTFKVLDDSVKPVQFRVSAKAASLNRAKPSNAWIASNILPNAALFQPGRTLALEVGLLETKLNPGEYSIINGQYMVPLRAVVERLGGQVKWDQTSRSGQVIWNGRTLTADVSRGELVFSLPGGAQEKRAARVEIIGGSIWVPLRELLETAGHPLEAISATSGERRVKAA